MDQGEFHRQLQKLTESQQGQFGYPFLSLKQVAEALHLDRENLIRLVEAERAAGHLVMNPIDEKTAENLPASLLALTLDDPDGEARVYVSLALKP